MCNTTNLVILGLITMNIHGQFVFVRDFVWVLQSCFLLHKYSANPFDRSTFPLFPQFLMTCSLRKFQFSFSISH